MSNEQHIKMVLTNEKDIQSKVLTKDDQTTAYIILQNSKYQSMIENITNENIELKRQAEDQESELDSLSRSKTCLQGYVKNEYEFAQNWKLMSNYYKQLHDTTFLTMNASLVVYMFVMMIGMLLPTINHIRIFICVFNSVFVICYGKFLFYMYTTHYKNIEIQKITAEILKIEKNNLYIQDLIDNI